MKCREIIERLEALAPPSMACEWDNPGLLAGRMEKEVATILLAVDATDEVIEEALEAGADMIITHHPLIFRALKKVNDQDFIGRRILRMIQSDISYYAMHTNFDAAPGCMGDLAGERLRLRKRGVLEPMGTTDSGQEYGIGIWGELEREMSLLEAASLVKEAFDLPHVTVFGAEDGKGLERRLLRAACCPGAGGSTMGEALRAGADVYITGDISHHEGIDAVAQGMAVIDAGHYGIEHIFMDFMEEYLRKALGDGVKVVKASFHLPAEVF